ncbi:hypothetical protein EDB84DRAFT_1562819 [Lactarius hengduanensis]|nr:hypothetical protein EDB84DRAFT_1562819 [Lactarius hengduanensis]
MPHSADLRSSARFPWNTSSSFALHSDMMADALELSQTQRHRHVPLPPGEKFGSIACNGATKPTRPLNTAGQTSVSKLLTKFAAPNPFPDPKLKPLAKPKPGSATQFSTKQSASTPQKPAATQKPLTEAELNIGKYDGGFEIENEKRGEAVQGEAARELALDSSVSWYRRHIVSPFSSSSNDSFPVRYRAKAPTPEVAA